MQNSALLLALLAASIINICLYLKIKIKQAIKIGRVYVIKSSCLVLECLNVAYFGIEY